MYLQAVRDHKVERTQAIMIGDQILTDILGANRAGIDAIWVRPMSTHEFIGTKLVNRMIERVVRMFLYKHLEKAEGAEEVPFLPLIGPFKYKVVRQFAKFTVVGGSSFIIDAGLHYVLMFVISVGGVQLGEVVGSWLLHQWPAVGPWLNYERVADYGSPILKIPTAGIAIVNSFIWNRKWTFKIRDRHNRHKQFVGFVVWSVLGMVLNVLILSAVNGAIPGHGKRSWAIGTAVATIVVALWNFLGQKFVLFKAKEPRL
jgi:putative flippase GtrA